MNPTLWPRRVGEAAGCWARVAADPAIAAYAAKYAKLCGQLIIWYSSWASSTGSSEMMPKATAPRQIQIHFSHWLMGRTEAALAVRLRPRKNSDYASVEDHRRQGGVSLVGGGGRLGAACGVADE